MYEINPNTKLCQSKAHLLLHPDLREILVWDSNDFALFDFGERWTCTKVTDNYQKGKKKFFWCVTDTYLDEDWTGGVLLLWRWNVDLRVFVLLWELCLRSCSKYSIYFDFELKLKINRNLMTFKLTFDDGTITQVPLRQKPKFKYLSILIN